METILGSALINALGGFAEHFVFCFFLGGILCLGWEGEGRERISSAQVLEVCDREEGGDPRGLERLEVPGSNQPLRSQRVCHVFVCVKGSQQDNFLWGLFFPSSFFKGSQKGQLLVRGGSSRNLGLHVFLSLKANQQDSLFALAGGRSRICWGVLSFFGVGTRIVGVGHQHLRGCKQRGIKERMNK